jgi:hypothetical protein
MLVSLRRGTCQTPQVHRISQSADKPALCNLPLKLNIHGIHIRSIEKSYISIRSFVCFLIRLQNKWARAAFGRQGADFEPRFPTSGSISPPSYSVSLQMSRNAKPQKGIQRDAPRYNQWHSSVVGEIGNMVFGERGLNLISVDKGIRESGYSGPGR